MTSPTFSPHPTSKHLYVKDNFNRHHKPVVVFHQGREGTLIDFCVGITHTIKNGVGLICDVPPLVDTVQTRWVATDEASFASFLDLRYQRFVVLTPKEFLACVTEERHLEISFHHFHEAFPAHGDRVVVRIRRGSAETNPNPVVHVELHNSEVWFEGTSRLLFFDDSVLDVRFLIVEDGVIHGGAS